MSEIESGVPSFDTDFTSHSPRKTRNPCFFVQYVFNVTKSIRNGRLVSPPAKFLSQPFGGSSFQLLHSVAERRKVAVLSMVFPA